MTSADPLRAAAFGERSDGGGETIDGGPGDIVIGPPGISHGFTNLGPGRARLVCIHGAPAMKTEFIE